MRLGHRSDFRRSITATISAAALCILAAGCSLIVATPSSHPLVVSDIDNGKSVTLAPGAKLEVSLSATSGTGYAWQIAGNNPAVLQPLGLGNFEMPNAAPPGATGAQVFHFEAAAAGTAKLAMVYRRPWEKDIAPARTWSITVRVQD
jgi:inhibitor of cysteine peptidase